MYEYLKDRPDTWHFQKLPDVPEWFEKELRAIGGLNPHGLPVLRVVKGNEVLSDRTEEKRLKYHLGYSPAEVAGYEYEQDGVKVFTTELENVPQNVFVLPKLQKEPLGLLRYVIEKWTSPQELEAENRFKKRYAPGDLDPTLRSFPREGIYEEYYVVQKTDGSFRHLDNLVLDFIRFKWKHEQQTSAEERQALYEAYERETEEAAERAYEERIEAIFEGDLRLPQEEIERRNEFWAKYDYQEDRARGFTR